MYLGFMIVMVLMSSLLSVNELLQYFNDISANIFHFNFILNRMSKTN